MNAGFALVLVLMSVRFGAPQTQSPGAAVAPPVTVADLIDMRLFGSSTGQDVHEVSPDRGHVALVLRRGNRAANTVDYAVVVFRTADALRDPASRPDTVAAFSATGNEPAISRVQWLPDSRSLAFLGRPAGGAAQVYTADIATHAITARTQSATGVTSFELGPAGEPVIYQEQRTSDTTRHAAMRSRGFVLSPAVWLTDAIAGDWIPGQVTAEPLFDPRGERIRV